MDPIQEVLARLVDRVENRHYGKYRGIVTDVADPRWREMMDSRH